MTHPSDHLDPTRIDAAELAELYAAGLLASDELAELERRVATGDAAILAELRAVAPALELISESPVEPARSLRGSVLARIDTEGTADDADEAAHHHPANRAGIIIHQPASNRWRRMGHGVQYQTLYADRKANRRTVILRMDAGSSLPEHEHAGVEEVIVLKGDLSIAGTELGAGDYIRVHPGADHGVPRSRSGCEAIVISSYVAFPFTSYLNFVGAAIKGLFTKPK